MDDKPRTGMQVYRTRAEMGREPAVVEQGETVPELPDTDDIVELAKAAVPSLVRKAVGLAHESKNLTSVLGVLNAMMDRAHGKPVQSMQHMGAGGGPMEHRITLEFVEPGRAEPVDVVSERVMLVDDEVPV